MMLMGHFPVDGKNFLSFTDYSFRRLISTRLCPEYQPWLFGYDAIKEADEAVRREPLRSLQRPVAVVKREQEVNAGPKSPKPKPKISRMVGALRRSMSSQ